MFHEQHLLEEGQGDGGEVDVVEPPQLIDGHEVVDQLVGHPAVAQLRAHPVGRQQHNRAPRLAAGDLLAQGEVEALVTKSGEQAQGHIVVADE